MGVVEAPGMYETGLQGQYRAQVYRGLGCAGAVVVQGVCETGLQEQ